MHKKIFYTFGEIFRQLWLPITLVVGIGIIRAFLWNYAYVLFQKLIDRFASASQLADLTPLLAGYVAVNLLNHMFIYAEGYPGTIIHSNLLGLIIYIEKQKK